MTNCQFDSCIKRHVFFMILFCMAISWVSVLSSNQTSLNRAINKKVAIIYSHCKLFPLMHRYSLQSFEQHNVFLFWWRESKNHTYSLNLVNKKILMKQYSELSQQSVHYTKRLWVLNCIFCISGTMISQYICYWGIYIIDSSSVSVRLQHLESFNWAVN